MPRVGLQCVVVVFPDNTHLLFNKQFYYQTNVLTIYIYINPGALKFYHKNDVLACSRIFNFHKTFDSFSSHITSVINSFKFY